MKDELKNQEGCLYVLVVLGVIFGWIPVFFMLLIGSISILGQDDPITALVSPFVAILLIVMGIILLIGWLALYAYEEYQRYSS